eukprot:208989-Prymnesium_polylepis.1
MPIVPVYVNGKGYDFEAAIAMLANLDSALPAQSLTLLRRELSGPHRSLKKLKRVLMSTIPNKMSVMYSPNASESQMVATIADIFDKIARLEDSEGKSALLRVSSR